jgi:hypothetical protein
MAEVVAASVDKRGDLLLITQGGSDNPSKLPEHLFKQIKKAMSDEFLRLAFKGEVAPRTKDFVHTSGLTKIVCRDEVAVRWVKHWLPEWDKADAAARKRNPRGLKAWGSAESPERDRVKVAMPVDELEFLGNRSIDAIIMRQNQLKGKMTQIKEFQGKSHSGRLMKTYLFSVDEECVSSLRAIGFEVQIGTCSVRSAYTPRQNLRPAEEA